VYTIGSCPIVGAVIYNYTQVNGTVVEQSEYGRIGSETTSVYRSPLLLIKYNSSGQVQWVQAITQSVTEQNIFINNQRLIIDKDNNIIFTCSYGHQNASISLLRTLLFQQQTGKDASNFLTFTPIGSFTVQGSHDGLVVKYNSSGTPLWFTKIANGSTTTQELINDVVIDSSSNIYICGQFGGSTASSVTDNKMMIYNSSPLVPGTNTLITPTEFGQIQCPAPLITAGFILKYNSDGQVQWVHMILGTNTATPNNKYNALCQNILIDKLDNIIVRGWYQTMAATPLTNPIQTLNYTTTTLNFTQSLYVFDSVVSGTPNKIQFNLFGQIPFIGSNTSIFMKFTPTGSVEWVNAQDIAGTSTTFKTYAVDSSNNFYYGFLQGATTPLTYSYVSGLLANSVINIQPTGVQIATGTTNTFNIRKINTNGTMIGLARLYSPFAGINITGCVLSISPRDEIVISGNYTHSSTTTSQRSMYITNFVNAVNNQFDPSTSLYGIIPIAKDQDVFLLKYSPTGQGAWAINLNTGPTFATTLSESVNTMVVKGQYVYLDVRFGSLPLRLQTFTGIGANSIIQQTGSIVMNYIDSATSGITGMTLNTALLKYSL
jgi:hypothetical protein